MSLSLPEDLEPFADPDRWHDSCVYVLVLDRPDDVGLAWNRIYDVRPPWFDEFRDADHALYVGATNDCLSRLEDHRNGKYRQAALMQVCPPHSLHDVWLFDDADRAFERESGIALDLQEAHPGWHVHQR